MTAPAQITALPCWSGTLSAAPLEGGLSNESWLVTDAAGQHVARFGRDFPFHHVDRAREVATARAAHAAGFGPAVEYAAPGVSVVQFIPSRTWTAADVRAAPDRIGALLRRFHDGMAHHISGTPYIFWPFHVIRDYARTIAAGGSPFAPDLSRYLALSDRLEVAQIPLPIIFGHHDLLPANILDDGSRLWLIDYEYAGFGTAMFDLAGVASNAGMMAGETSALLQAYLGQPPDVDFQRAFDAMQCASLLREAMWAMVSDIHLAAPGSDYRSYARDNLMRLEAALNQFTQTHGTL
ncbi:MAG: phosphotransferase [Pseudotabrizicola sp.]|uniref:phosphotransferase n=1 Tax=Pseudotabrizicola sp. TaxID=2939647 RepID=UPI0027311F59|nr:phosphotransferase [Pseudotabrizicola sp.]MDP2081270.1 phosphotransferase [Pseudotabrizicola sp.]MDZ7576111.1 phosphotransferase [Pseudotabrizicola sp.]